MRLLPRSLFGRLLLVLASGLILAQLLSAAINFAERDSALGRASGMQPAQRIADIVRLLDSLGPAERARIVGILNVPPLVVALDRVPPAEESAAIGGAHAAMLSAFLRAALGDERLLRVTMSGKPPVWAGGEPGPGARRRHFQEGPMGPGGMHRFAPDGPAVLVQVRLLDGTWATFDTQAPQASASPPWRLLATLLVLLAAVLLLSFVAVRWVTRPLHLLAAAADDLGRDINRPPLPEGGPAEVSRAARAFNTMQSLIRFIDERTRQFTAMSHDLDALMRSARREMRTAARELEADMLGELWSRAEFMRGLREPGRKITSSGCWKVCRPTTMGARFIAGQVSRPCFGPPQLLRRCLANLIDNAAIYGQRADVSFGESASELTIRIRDHGPGIPEDELETVFEPFYRLERSRSRETGGTGLGLAIARSIAQAQGGDVRLRNHPDGGLEAILTLPWRRVSGPDATA
jgi:signal transduction histidine kinase